MACFHPLRGFQTPAGKVRIIGQKGARLPQGSRALLIPCGQCIGCRLARSQDWAARITNEASLYDHNIFVTLTYDDKHLPADLSLDHRHYQLFQKRLRKHLGYQPRYFMCGEYGEARGRPHYHTCLLNLHFKDQLFYSNRGGNKIYTSATLDAIWQMGECKIGALTMESAAYVARYCTQTITGKDKDKAYRLYDSTTGETWVRKPEYGKMSNRPGIGAPWLHKYVTDIYPKGEHYVGGHFRKPPRYYDNLFRKHYDNNDTVYNEITKRREARAILQQPDNTKARREVKEELAQIRFKQLKRSLK